jgi:hypothetical protein
VGFPGLRPSEAALARSYGLGRLAGLGSRKEKAGLRGQALKWLKANLVLWKRQAETANPMGRALVQRVLWAWQNNPGLASVRDRAGLAKLPEPERKAWEKLWADVETLRKRVREPK